MKWARFSPTYSEGRSNNSVCNKMKWINIFVFVSLFWFEGSIFIVTTYKTEIYSLYKEIICYREESRTDSLLALESVNLYRKIGHKAELRTTKALTSQLQWKPTNYVHPCYSNWKLPKATALWNRKSYPIFCWSRRWKLHIYNLTGFGV